MSLYLIYTMDLPIIFNEDPKTTMQTTDTEATTYVDGTTVNMYKQENTTMQQTLDDMYKLKDYMSANKLIMSEGKTQFMISKNTDNYKDVDSSPT